MPVGNLSLFRFISKGDGMAYQTQLILQDCYICF